MTLEQLLQSSADELERMTDAELDTFFSQFKNITRPELVVKEDANNISRPSAAHRNYKTDPALEAAKKKAREIMEKAGLKLPGF